MLKNITALVDSLTTLIGGGITTLLMGLAFVAFLFSIINFIWKRRSGNDDGLKDAKNLLWWSVVGLFVMVSVWGLVGFIQSSLLPDAKTTIDRPQTVFNSSNNPGAAGKKAANETCTAPSECASGKCTGLVGASSKTCDQ